MSEGGAQAPGGNVCGEDNHVNITERIDEDNQVNTTERMLAHRWYFCLENVTELKSSGRLSL